MSNKNEADLVAETIAEEPKNLRPIEELNKTEQEKEQAQNDTENTTANNDTQNSRQSFDPNIHRIDSFGQPILNNDGTYQKKRGRKAGTKSGPQNVNASPVDDAKIQAHQLGMVTAETIFSLCQGLMGPEWCPIVDAKQGVNEREHMTNAWANYYLMTGKRDLPPSMMVIVAMTVYAAPRFQVENTRSKFGKFGMGVAKFAGWIKGKIFKSRKKDEQ